MKKRKIKKQTGVLLLGIVIFIFGVLTMNFIIKNNTTEKSLPHQNNIDKQISLYSNKHASVSAMATNPKFQHIAFENRPIEKPIFGNQVASVFGAVRSFAKSFFKTKAPLEKEYGSWLWTPVLQMTPEYMESILTGAKANGVDTIYVSIDSYLDIFVMKEGADKENRKAKFSSILEDFIRKAGQKGIAVDAEAGWQNWAEFGNDYKALAILNFVKDFNATHTEKFRGFQYDVEPYLLEAYKIDPVPVLRNFVNLVDKTEYFLEKDDLRFSIVVPDFYDKKDEVLPKFSYNNKNGYVLEHIIKILDRKMNSSIIVMSYRNFAEGRDGSIEVSSNEMKTAKKNAENTKIIIAQETGNFPPPYITFHNKSKKDMTEEVSKIKETFETHPNFGGIAVHYVNTFLELK